MGAGVNNAPAKQASPNDDDEIIANLEMIDDMEVVTLPQDQWQTLGEIPEPMFHDPHQATKAVEEGEDQ